MPARKESPTGAIQASAWPAVLCLIGLDYFSTLAYQPSMAFESAGILAPIATVAVVLVTLFGVLPVYAYVAGRSPEGQGAIGLLERHIHGWRGKTIVLVLLGFVATDFVITKTISAANAAEHILANPAWKSSLDSIVRLGQAEILPSLGPFWGKAFVRWDEQMVVTMILLVLGFGFWAWFRSGFTRRVIQMSVVVVSTYLVLNAIVIGSAVVFLVSHPQIVSAWYQRLLEGNWSAAGGASSGGGLWAITSRCALSFPEMVIGMSGFELCLVVMPLVRFGKSEPGSPRDRIRGTRRLLVAAAVLMSIYLLGSISAVSMLIPPEAFEPGGSARHRTLAYLAHGGELTVTEGSLSPFFGPTFGSMYDLSTVVILCLAGASVTIGLRDLVPQYLLRLGMELKWAHNVGAILHLFNCINLLIVLIFRASVEAQRGAYVLSVVVLMSSAALASVIDLRASLRGFWRQWALPLPFLGTSAILLVTALVTLYSHPSGFFIAIWFVLAIVVTSFLSRAIRSTELRFLGFDFKDEASRGLWERLKSIRFPILVPHRPGRRSLHSKEEDIRRVHRLSAETPIVFIEAELGDVSDFLQRPTLEASQADGRFVLHVTRCVSIAHLIAAVSLELSQTDSPPEIHFGWSDETPIAANLNFVLFGEGNIPWLVRELIRQAEPRQERRPRIVIG